MLIYQAHQIYYREVSFLPAPDLLSALIPRDCFLPLTFVQNIAYKFSLLVTKDLICIFITAVLKDCEYFVFPSSIRRHHKLDLISLIEITLKKPRCFYIKYWNNHIFTQLFVFLLLISILSQYPTPQFKKSWTDENKSQNFVLKKLLIDVLIKCICCVVKKFWTHMGEEWLCWEWGFKAFKSTVFWTERYLWLYQRWVFFLVW